MRNPDFTSIDFPLDFFHDMLIHGMGFDGEVGDVFFDVDYVIDVRLGDDGLADSAELALATIVFRNCFQYSIELDPDIDNLGFTFEATNPRPPINAGFASYKTVYDFEFELSSGHITLTASDFEVFVRKRIWHDADHFTLKERGGISFSLE